MSLIKDPYFKIEIDWDGSSPNPETAIWKAQNVCVAENAQSSQVPSNPGKAVVRHQLKVGHYSVLNFASVTVRCFGFSHNTVMQMVRHRDSAFLVQSMRYTGERLKAVTPDNIEQFVYIRPVGEYIDRQGNRFELTSHKRQMRLDAAYQSVAAFQDSVALDGEPFESGRDVLPTGFRQDFTMSGTLENFFHWLDQRTKKDSQLETQTLAWMVLEELKNWAPEIVGWYISNRAGRANLAP